MGGGSVSRIHDGYTPGRNRLDAAEIVAGEAPVMVAGTEHFPVEVVPIVRVRSTHEICRNPGFHGALILDREGCNGILFACME